MNKKRKIGIILLVAGVVKLFLLKQVLTGSVIGASTRSGLSLLGAIIFIAGIVLILMGREGGLENLAEPKIIRTSRFNKSIKGRPKKAIEDTIDKLKKGLGKQEKLKYGKGYSIRVSKGGRIEYDIVSGGDVVLDRYSDHYKY